jgi:shikimate kinase/3-dehydroquinate synthase
VNLIIYGPPGSGKSTVGRLAARQLGREFVDGDAWLEAHWGRAIADYFAAADEALFRQREAETYRNLAERSDLVVAPGGGALLNPHLRAVLERSGVIVCLTASFATLSERLERSPAVRPLLADDLRGRLGELLRERETLYKSFALQVDTDHRSAAAAAAEAVALFCAAAGATRFELGPTSAFFGRGVLGRLPELIAQRGLRPAGLIIADATAAALHGAPLSLNLGAPIVTFPPGEASKNLATIGSLYTACAGHGIERGGTLVALGGGVAGDMAGFVAATYMRGVAWVNVPTTVLAMADASLGGKVGVDLPEGKNLVGAFHPPALVAADFDVLATLPEIEARCGMAEIIKSGLIGDAGLFEALLDGSVALEAAILRAAAVKVGVVNADPYERGERATLNLGHTIGHGVEAASGYKLKHGEAVAIGLAGETRLAQALGLAESDLYDRVIQGLSKLGLPRRSPGLPPNAILEAMQSDKKKSGGRLKFALPRRPGEVVWGQEVEPGLLQTVLEELTRVE